MIKDIIKSQIQILKDRIAPTTTDGKQFERNVIYSEELRMFEKTLDTLNKHYSYIGKKVFKFEKGIGYVISDGCVIEYNNPIIKEEILFTDDLYNKYCINLVKYQIEYYSNSLLEGDLVRNSTSPIKNLEFTWELQAKQNVIKFFKDLLN